MSKIKFMNHLKDANWISVTEAVIELRISRTPIYKLIQAGKISAVKVGNCYRINLPQLRQFIANGGDWVGK